MKSIESWLNKIQTIANVISSVVVLLVAIGIISNKLILKDFVFHTFKVWPLFILFIILLVVLFFACTVKFRATATDNLDDDRITQNKKYNNRIKTLRIATLIISIIVFFSLLWFQFDTPAFGIVEGEMENPLLASQIESIINDSMKAVNVSPMKQITYAKMGDDEYAKDLFRNEFKSGVVYSTQYNDHYHIIHMKIKWIGKAECFIDTTTFTKQFMDCRLSLDSDGAMISNFIIGFVQMHHCDTTGALSHFLNVSKMIYKMKDQQKKAALHTLTDWIEHFTAFAAAKNRADSNEHNSITYKEFPSDLKDKFVCQIQSYPSPGVLFCNIYTTFTNTPIWILTSQDTAIVIEPYMDNYILHNSYEREFSKETVPSKGISVTTNQPDTVIPERDKRDTIAKGLFQEYLTTKYRTFSRYEISHF